MTQSLDEITYDMEEEGRVVRRELGRRVLSEGAWPTVMFLFQEIDRTTEEWKAPRAAIVRFQKRQGQYRKHCSFVTDETQARQLVSALEGWFSDEAKAARGDAVEGADFDAEAGAEVEPDSAA